MRETILHTIKECKRWKKPTLESKRGHKMHEIAKEKSVRVSENASAARAGPCKVLKALQDGPGKRSLLMIGDKNFRIFLNTE